MLGLLAPLHNALRSLRSLWSNLCCESDHEAREYACGPEALRFSAAHSRPDAVPPSGQPAVGMGLHREETHSPARRRARPGQGELAPPRSADFGSARVPARFVG